MKNYHQAQFFTSVAELSQLPSDIGYEVAFIGRSNAGKSSVLNALTKQKNLARTSKTPGRTQLINFFKLDEQHRLVDLPGYGYAQASINVKNRWQQTLVRYLESRQCLKGIVLLMDIRHPLTTMDQRMINWTHYQNIPLHVLLTKSDKLKRGPAMQSLQQTRKALSGQKVTIQLFSVKDRLGLPELYQCLDQWFEY